MILQPSFHSKALRRDNWSHSTQQWPQHSKPLMSTRFQDYNNYFQIRERVNRRLSLGSLVQEVCGGTTLSVVGKQWNCRGEIMEGDERAEVTWHCRKGSQRELGWKCAGACVCTRADVRGRKINHGWTGTRSAELVWCRLAFLIISIHPSQGSVLRNPVSPLHYGLTTCQFKEFILLCMNWSLFQWTENQSINMCELMNKAFNFSRNKNNFFLSFQTSRWMFWRGQIVNSLASLPQFSHSGHSDTSPASRCIQPSDLFHHEVV